ncbi:PRTase-like protein [Amniculicola lignicola CBS 123094]|uniref:adenine phosphoribosyltransferase n=1 Tax=Amniculicola lignicola CBS 123094 TaxID=1392246 RepID=A0A6A5WX36_9PLEO|nr:PRTase-like protein [Amniculicola lignicola CBS 123094]
MGAMAHAVVHGGPDTSPARRLLLAEMGWCRRAWVESARTDRLCSRSVLSTPPSLHPYLSCLLVLLVPPVLLVLCLRSMTDQIQSTVHDRKEDRRRSSDLPSTSAHPSSATDPTLTSGEGNASQGRLAASASSSAAELASLKIKLTAAIRQFPDFPSPGILFEDILPIFADTTLHEGLIRALELHVSQAYEKPDVIVGLDARGFLFGPSLALRMGAGFVPVRKKGKVPGPTVTASFEKEYGEDFFQMQSDGVRPGQKVLIVDDIIATGMSRLYGRGGSA